MLYAAGIPVLVIDAYTRRVFARLGVIGGQEPYDVLQCHLARELPRDASVYNEFHAQVVTLAKQMCRPRPHCEACPLAAVCEKRGVSSA